MSLTTNGGWIHSFTVTETNTHKKGYTVYKITSIVFPRAIPQALTCINTWKRFHDIKRLYRELQKRYKSLHGIGHVPEPKGESFFKRFQPEIIEARKVYIIELLDFAAQHPALYKCPVFLQFFDENDGHTPNLSPLHCNKKLVGGNIENICDNIDLIFEDDIKLIDPNKEPLTLTGTGAGALSKKRALYKKSTPDSNTNDPEKLEQNESNIEVVVVHKIITPSKQFSKTLTPMVSIEAEDMDYIYEAALEFSHAVQAEVNMEYKEAYRKYKNGVETLLGGSKDDNNDERKFIAKAKVVKYMARADEIYEKYILNLDNDKNLSFQLSIDIADSPTGVAPNIEEIYLERPWNQLSRFKVMKILDSLILQVQDVTDKSIYIIKGIEKPSCNSSAQSIFLPQNVPYMVELVSFFQSHEKIFLLLRKAKGGKLFDYIRTYTPTINSIPASLNDLFKEFEDIPTGNHLFESETILSQTNEISAALNDQNTPKYTVKIEEIPFSSINDENQHVSSNYDRNIPILENVTDSMDVNELVNCSQKLLESVEKTLNKFKVEKVEEVEQKTENCENIVTNIENIPNSTSFSKKTVMLPEASIKQWARELITAIECLHSKGVILGDLHTDNLLLGSKGQLLISYFYQHEGGNPESHLFDNPLVNETLCVAPERPFTFKSDWWSLGVILFELITSYSFRACHPGGIYTYFEIQFPNVEISSDAKSLLEGLLQQKPDRRLNYHSIKSHEFFAGTIWEDVAKNGQNSN